MQRKKCAYMLRSHTPCIQQKREQWWRLTAQMEIWEYILFISPYRIVDMLVLFRPRFFSSLSRRSFPLFFRLSWNMLRRHPTYDCDSVGSRFPTVSFFLAIFCFVPLEIVHATVKRVTSTWNKTKKNYDKLCFTPPRICAVNASKWNCRKNEKKEKNTFSCCSHATKYAYCFQSSAVALVLTHLCACVAAPLLWQFSAKNKAICDSRKFTMFAPNVFGFFHRHRNWVLIREKVCHVDCIITNKTIT